MTGKDHFIEFCKHTGMVNTKFKMLPDTPDHQVIIIVVTDGYTSFLYVAVRISLPYPFVVRSGRRGVRKYREIWNSFTTVPNLTNLIVRTIRHLLAVIEINNQQTNQLAN